MNSMSLSFWSTSRSSVNSTRRNVFQRASSAANEEATPTFSNSVNSRSLTEVSVSIGGSPPTPWEHDPKTSRPPPPGRHTPPPKPPFLLWTGENTPVHPHPLHL